MVYLFKMVDLSMAMLVITRWLCLKIGYPQWNSNLIGKLISKTIGFRHTWHFQTNPDGKHHLSIGLWLLEEYPPINKLWFINTELTLLHPWFFFAVFPWPDLLLSQTESPCSAHAFRGELLSQLSFVLRFFRFSPRTNWRCSIGINQFQDHKSG